MNGEARRRGDPDGKDANEEVNSSLKLQALRPIGVLKISWRTEKSLVLTFNMWYDLCGKP